MFWNRYFNSPRIYEPETVTVAKSASLRDIAAVKLREVN